MKKIFHPETLLKLHELEFAKDTSDSLKEESQQIRSDMAPTELAKYDALRARFGEMVLVPSQGGACSACHMAMSRIQQSASKLNIVVCEHCGRMVYDPELQYQSTLS